MAFIKQDLTYEQVERIKNLVDTKTIDLTRTVFGIKKEYVQADGESNLFGMLVEVKYEMED